MNVVTHLLERFWDALDALERSRRDAWLAQSADIHDLEERIRSLERQATRGSW